MSEGTVSFLMFLLTMVSLITIGVVPAVDLQPHQKVKLAIFFFLFGFIGYMIGRLGAKHKL